MTPQEALKVIDKVHDYPCPYGIGGTAWMYIRNCIEKQIPKKPVKTRNEIVCPTCETLVGSNPYCKYCGQALNWNDVNV